MHGDANHYLNGKEGSLMSIRMLRAELRDLTPELCQRFSTMPRLDGERDLNESHIKFLDEHLRAGTFYSPTWCVAIVKGYSVSGRIDRSHCRL